MEKLLAIVSLAQNIYGRWLSRRLLYGAVVFISLAIVISTMVSAMLVGSFYAGYLALLDIGFGKQTAIGIIGAIILVLTLLLILFAVRYLQRLREAPRQMLRDKIPQFAQAGEVIDAFLEGLMRT